MGLKSNYNLWAEFLEKWPFERVRSMGLDDYTNPDKDDAFIYWLEVKLSELGGIGGGSAFKFGIFFRSSIEQKENKRGLIYGEKYAWYTKYGSSAQEAFRKVKSIIIEIIEASQAGNLELIDEIDFSHAVKWKVAFLYQDRQNPIILPIFKKEGLLYIYQKLDPQADKKTPFSLMYSTLIDAYEDKAKEDLMSLANDLWQQWQIKEQAIKRAWAVPLTAATMTPEEIEKLCGKSKITSEDLDGPLLKILNDADLSVGDRLALLEDSQVRALAEISFLESEDVEWKQTPVSFPADIEPLPAYEIQELDASEQAKIWKDSKAKRKDRAKDDQPEIVEQVPVEMELTQSTSKPCIPKSIILYGPPGTGKTYSTIRRSLELILGEARVKSMSREVQEIQFRQLQQEGRIEFVTFHQAYGYEEFIEGIRPVLETESEEVRYELHHGAFKRIALRAAEEGLRRQEEKVTFDELWSQLVKRVSTEGPILVESASKRPYQLTVSTRGNFQIMACDVDDEGNVSLKQNSGPQTASKNGSKMLWDNRNEFGEDPDQLTDKISTELFARNFGSSGGHHFTAYWIIFNELLTLSRSAVFRRQVTGSSPERVQATLDKPTAGKVDFQFSENSRQYVLVIDEINRGNMSKILGELITLLEPEKRLGNKEELKLPLSYSPEHRFAVPPNLHIIGTMNTADRSIALMDVALRRRFNFEELMPDKRVLLEVLRKKAPDESFIQLVNDIFVTLNKRITFLYDREHQLGHSYFLGAVDYAALQKIILDRIIPLLQEYFYGAWDKICMILGCPYDEDGLPLRGGVVVNDGSYRAPVVQTTLIQEVSALGFSHDEFENRLDYTIHPVFADTSGTADTILDYFLGILQLTLEEEQEFREMLVQGGLYPKQGE